MFNKKNNQIRPRLKGNPQHWMSIIARAKELGLKEAIATLYGRETMTDGEIVEESEKIAKKHQRQRDLRRIENKTWRHQTRTENAISEYVKRLIDRIESNPITVSDTPHEMVQDGDILILQLSDTHFNELVNIQSNKYDFKVAAKRLFLLASDLISLGKWKGSKGLVVSMGGDLLNSDRRKDELLSMATNRSNATLLAVELLLKFLSHLAEHFNITLCSVTGNESRTGQELGWSELLATDSYDTMIYGMLHIYLRNDARFTFLPMTANEKVFSVNGVTFLQIHGHQVKRNTQNSVQNIIGKYNAKGTEINYVLFGHIHATEIGDYFARNASLVGSNAYSEEGLNFVSKAAQNVHIVSENGRVCSMKVDLQNVESVKGYDINSECDCYHVKSVDKLKTKVTIHEIVI